MSEQEQSNPLAAAPCNCDKPQFYVDKEDGEYRCNGCGRVAPIQAAKRKQDAETARMIRLATRYAIEEANKRSGTRIEGALLDPADAAKLLGVPKTWVLQEARADRIPYLKLGHYVRFDRAELEAWWRTRMQGPSRKGRKAA